MKAMKNIARVVVATAILLLATEVYPQAHSPAFSLKLGLTDIQSSFCSVARVARTNSRTRLAHYLVRRHGVAVSLGMLSLLPKTSFIGTDRGLLRSILGPSNHV